MILRRALAAAVLCLGAAAFAVPATSVVAAGTTSSDGTLDMAATNSTIGTLPADHYVTGYLPLRDGRIAIIGTFDSYNGTPVHQMVVLTASGEIDATFNANMGSGFLYTPSCNQCGRVAAMVVRQQTDGKILVAGFFQSFNGTQANNLVRLNPDGTLDAAFASNLGAGFDGGAQSSVGVWIRDVLIQPDGRIIVVGDYMSINGTQVNFISRLNADGSPDTTYNSNVASTCVLTVNAAVLLPTGNLIGAGCDYGQSRLNGVFSVDSTGIRSAAFDAATGTGFRTTRYDMSNQPYETTDAPWSVVRTIDGGILLGGSFSRFNGASSPRGLLKIRTDGTLDRAFNSKLLDGLALLPTTEKPQYVDAFVSDMKVQPDGKILLIGYFDTIAGKSHKNIARLNADGSVDSSFVGSADFGEVAFDSKLTLLPKGGILVTGTFSSWNGTAVRGYAVLGTAPRAVGTSAATTPSTGSPARPAMVFVAFTLVALGGLLLQRGRRIA